MKCLIIFYSLTNATSQIAENISVGLNQAGVDTELCNIKNDIPPDLQGFDMLGIGTPVYYYQIPLNVLECIESLSNKNKIKAFAFLTNGSYAWNAGHMLKRAMAKRGFTIQGWFYSHGTDYFLPYLRLGCLASPDYPTSENLASAQKFGFDMLESSTATLWPESIQSPPIIYRLEQILTRRILIRRFYQKNFYLDKEKCIRCDTCVKGCPVQNIHRKDGGFPHWDKKCIMCLSCELNCPKEAIQSPVSWFVMKPLMEYNVKKIMEDSTLEKIKIRHHNGKIIRD